MKLRPDLGISSSLDTLLLISFGRLAFFFYFIFFRFSFPFFYSLWYCYLVISFPRCVIDTLSALLLYPTSVWGNNRLRIHHLCHPYDFVLALLSLLLSLPYHQLYWIFISSEIWHLNLFLFFPNIRRTPKRKENKPHLCIFDFNLRFQIPASTGRLYELVTFGHTKMEATHLTIAISRLFFENSYLPSSSLSCRIRTFYFLFFWLIYLSLWRKTMLLFSDIVLHEK